MDVSKSLPTAYGMWRNLLATASTCTLVHTLGLAIAQPMTCLSTVAAATDFLGGLWLLLAMLPHVPKLLEESE